MAVSGTPSPDGPLEGVLNVLKPPGLTSHDVVSYLRRTLGLRRVGHTGTLDPDAAGVLVVCLGRATRLAEYLLDTDKSYRAEMTLGIRTSTQDAGGEVLTVGEAAHLTAADVEALWPRFLGEMEQVPPMVSAKKQRGQRLYRLARAGQEVERTPQRVTIYDLRLVDFQPGRNPRVLFDVTCSKGTYVRTLCADLGEALGCGATLSFLLRTRVGTFRLAEAWTLEEVAASWAAGDLATRLIPFEAALPHLPAVIVDAAGRAKLACGQALRPEEVVRVEKGPLESPFCFRDEQGALLAIGQIEGRGAGGPLRPQKVFVRPGSPG